MARKPEHPEVAKRASFEIIRYASVWEDADLLCRSLAPVAGGKSLLSIASAGDNALALLTLNPKQVVAADLSAAQLACVDLRLAAFARLDYPQLLAFLGVTPAPDRLEVYGRLKRQMNKSSRDFWDARPSQLEQGIIHQGKFERFLTFFGTRALPWLQGRRRCEGLVAKRDAAGQRRFYDQQWNTRRWRALFAVFFSRLVMGRAGRDPEFFRQVEGSVASRVLNRVRHGLREVPNWKNPYLVYIMTGNYRPQALPLYLREKHFRVIRSRVKRVKLVQGPIQEAGRGSFAGANLSDLFEYLGPDEFEAVYARLLQRMRKGGRLAYWNMLVPRQCPASMESRVRRLQRTAKALLSRDQAWFYQAFHLEEKR